MLLDIVKFTIITSYTYYLKNPIIRQQLCKLTSSTLNLTQILIPMKKILLSLLIISGLTAYSQSVVLNVMEPATIGGPYTHSNQGDGSGWGLADLTNPADAVLDTLAVMDDTTSGVNNTYGTPASPFYAGYQGCDSAGVYWSGSNYDGKIVLISRGSCQFGWKAFLAQEQGAVAVIIYNGFPDSDPSGGITNMAGGDYGMDVTIPVCFISRGDGELLRAAVDSGQTVVAFIGNKVGAFANDVSMSPTEVLYPESMATPSLIAQDSLDYAMNLGFWARNDGSNNQTAVVANAEVLYNGTSVYAQSTAPFGLNSLDSSYISFPPFAQGAYLNGEYKLTYSLTGLTDDFSLDNEIATDVYINDSIFTYARIADSNFIAIDQNSLKSSAFTTSWAQCINFQHQNASRMQMKGVRFANYSSDTIIGKAIDITVDTWDDYFAGLSDPNCAVTSTTGLVYDTYVYTSESQQDQTISHHFTSALPLVDYQRYLICLNTSDVNMYLNHSRAPAYELNDVSPGAQPKEILRVDSDWYTGGFSSGAIPTIQLIMEQNTVGIDEDIEVSVKPFPIPASNFINIQLPSIEGAGDLKVYDMAGNLVMTESNIQNNGKILKVDVSRLASGSYIFNLDLNNGKKSSFTVIVNK